MNHRNQQSEGVFASPKVIAALLFVVTLAVFWGTLKNDFVNYDDPVYLTENPHIQDGLTWKNVQWAFTTHYANFWHPLTWLSHLVDIKLFGFKPAGHHFVSIFLHAINGGLLFLVLRRFTGALWRSAIVAAMFALHPLHVESVVWASERKDLLSTLFWLMTMLSYGKYVELKAQKTSATKLYLVTLILFALGLMAKPMLVTLPFVLLLVDVWPLRRIDFGKGSASAGFIKLFVEKLPFFALAAGASALAFWSQQAGGALSSTEQFPLGTRIVNAFVSYLTYVVKVFVPVNLAVPYPYESSPAAWKISLAVTFVVGMSVLAFAQVRSRGYLLTGWFWFVGTLVPVIGIVQIGSFAMADRFTYVPLIGLFCMIVWGINELLGKIPQGRTVLSLGAAASLVTCIALTSRQIAYWRNTETLFSHSVQVTKKNYMAEYNLAKRLTELGRIDEAIAHYEVTLAINPNSFEAHNNVAGIYIGLGQIDKAISHLAEGVKLQPENAELQYNLGFALGAVGRLDEAIEHYRAAVRAKPDHIGALHNLAWFLATLPKPELRNGAEALQYARRACELTQFQDVRCFDALDAAYAEVGDYTNAMEIAAKAQQMASSAGQENFARGASERLNFYRVGVPYRSR